MVNISGFQPKTPKCFLRNLEWGPVERWQGQVEHCKRLNVAKREEIVKMKSLIFIRMAL